MKTNIWNRKAAATPARINFMSATKSVLGAAVLTAAFTFTSQALPPSTGVAPVSVPAGGFGIGGELVAGSSGGASGDWLAGANGAPGVLDATGAPLNPATTFHFVDAFNSSGDNVFGSSEQWTDNPNTWTWTTPGKQPPSSKTAINNILLHLTTAPNSPT